MFTDDDVDELAETVWQRANEAFRDPLLTVQDGIKSALKQFFTEHELMKEK
jgi:hypothetical protein